MPNESRHNRASTVMGKINRAWLDGRVDEMAPMIHPEIVMVLPAFSGQIQGRDAFLDGFHDFVQNATIHEFREIDQQVNVVGDTAVIHFKYKMVYEMAGRRYRATGRDLWVFQEHEETWLAVWRAMLNTDEQEV